MSGASEKREENTGDKGRESKKDTKTFEEVGKWKREKRSLLLGNFYRWDFFFLLF